MVAISFFRMNNAVTGDVHSSPVIEYRDFQIPKKRDSYFSHLETLTLIASGLGNPPERELFILDYKFHQPGISA